MIKRYYNIQLLRSYSVSDVILGFDPLLLYTYFCNREKTSIWMNKKHLSSSKHVKVLKLQHIPLPCWHINNETTPHIYWIGSILFIWVLSNLADFFTCKPIMQNRNYVTENFIVASAIKNRQRQTFYVRFVLYYQYCTQNRVS